MNSGTLGKIIFAVAALALAAWLVLRGGDRVRIDFGPYSALGIVSAEEVSRALNGQGRLVAVLPDPEGGENPVLEAQWDAFRKSLPNKSSLTIAAVERVKLDPFTSMRTGGALPPDKVMELHAKHSDADAFVCMMGFPMLNEDEIARLKEGKTRFFVISAALPGYEVLLREGVLELAIVPRPVASDQPGSEPSTPREYFDQEYIILRRE